jgi:hypothetical protein
MGFEHVRIGFKSIGPRQVRELGLPAALQPIIAAPRSTSFNPLAAHRLHSSLRCQSSRLKMVAIGSVSQVCPRRCLRTAD